MERAQDVLMHKRLLLMAHDPATRPAVEVHLVQVIYTQTYKCMETVEFFIFYFILKFSYFPTMVWGFLFLYRYDSVLCCLIRLNLLFGHLSCPLIAFLMHLCNLSLMQVHSASGSNLPRKADAHCSAYASKQRHG